METEFSQTYVWTGKRTLLFLLLLLALKITIIIIIIIIIIIFIIKIAVFRGGGDGSRSSSVSSNNIYSNQFRLIVTGHEAQGLHVKKVNVDHIMDI